MTPILERVGPRSDKMMTLLGLDPDQLMMCGRLMPRDLRVIATRCAACDHSALCDRVLAAGPQATAPDFCPNRTLFAFLDA